MLLASCGDPPSSQETFEFDPYPYTVEPLTSCTPVGENECTMAVSLDEDSCFLFVANDLLVLVETADADRFERWSGLWDWEIWHRGDLPVRDDQPAWTSFYRHVPLGSVPDAIEFTRSRFDVIEVHHNSLGYFPESPPPASSTCEAGKSQH